MRCKIAEKWISDYLDGELEAKKHSRLQEHLQSCQRCVAYQRQMQVLHEAVSVPEDMAFSAEYAAGSINRLKMRLTAEAAAQPPQIGPELSQSWSWRWGLAGSLAVAALLLFFFVFPRSQDSYDRGGHVFSLEEAMIQIYHELGNDPELERQFNLLLTDSIREEFEKSSPQSLSAPLGFPLFWEDLTDEELKFLESELKKEIKS